MDEPEIFPIVYKLFVFVCLWSLFSMIINKLRDV